MRYAIISDVHANETALRAVLADARSLGAEAVACLGDVVGYGPMPKEALELVRSSCAVVVAGNHDDAVSGKIDPAAFIDLAGDAVKRHREALSRDDIEWLGALPYTARIDGAAAAHGDFTAPEKFLYVESEEDAAANFAATDAQIMFVGHTHVPGVFITGRSGRTYSIGVQDFAAEDGKRYIVNPGSVGYPRENNGECLSSYVIYDSAERSVVFRFLPFSVASVMQRGTGGRRAKIGAAVAVAAAAVVAAVGAFVYSGRQSQRADEAERTVAAAAEAAKPLATRRISIPPGSASINAGLRLDRDSKSPVELKITYLSPDGSVLYTETHTVKRSKSKVPMKSGAKGASEAVLELRKCREEDEPAVLEFAPSP